MYVRSTTVGNMRTYRYNLQRASYRMNQALNTVITGRNFNYFAEDPSAASKSFQLRRSYLRTSSQYDLNQSVVSKYQVAWQALDKVDKCIDTEDTSALFELLRSGNDADASARNTLGQSMRAMAEDIIQSMNGRYADNFVFSGADGLNVPFTWGKAVNAENPDYVSDEDLAAGIEGFQYLQADGTGTNDETLAEKVYTLNPDYDPDNPDPNVDQYLKEDGTTTNDIAEAAWTPKENPKYLDRENLDDIRNFQYLLPNGAGVNEAKRDTIFYRGVPVDTADPEELKKLDYFSDEKKNVDIGLGYDTNGGQVEESSVFNMALQGVDFLGGYGLDEDGDPKNIVSMTIRISEILKNCASEDGKWASDAEKAEFDRLSLKFEDAAARVKNKYTEMDTQTAFLKTNQEQLKDNTATLNEQIQELDYIDEALSIELFTYAKYSYDVALKVGSSVLSQSLMDYLFN